MRLLVVAIALTLSIAAFGVWVLKPRNDERPLVTVYKSADCECCRLWMRHMAARGFRIQIGNEEEWSAVRARFKVPAGLKACHTAIVNGLVIEGHVPAKDVRWLIGPHNREGEIGLIVPGMPPGSPGMESLVPQSYTVFGLQPSGEVRALVKHEHEIY